MDKAEDKSEDKAEIEVPEQKSVAEVKVGFLRSQTLKRPNSGEMLGLGWVFGLWEIGQFPAQKLDFSLTVKCPEV